MPAIPGKRISSVGAGASKFVRMGHDGQSRFVNKILPGRDAVAPGYDFKIEVPGTWALADDGVSQVIAG